MAAVDAEVSRGGRALDRELRGADGGQTRGEAAVDNNDNDF